MGCGRQVELHKGSHRLGETGAKIGFDQSARLGCLIDKEGEGSSSAQCFDPNGTGPGKEVKHLAARYPGGKDVEQGLTHPIAGRADEGLAGFGRGQLTAARAAAGDAHGKNLSLWSKD
jgi:hypothetical protein